ncbi:hypothetical protein OSB04_019470 [Centaurea solstitialis]|uniref:Uncharacterized protein n=1 Tax=Centaurea solstitialis TaxID=347529 RepID=A0AA38T8X2_9ASTR|nr:hypothetical protein OSB04_019470 [Centaurea solstitialis]
MGRRKNDRGSNQRGGTASSVFEASSELRLWALHFGVGRFVTLPSCNNCMFIVVFRGWLFVYGHGLDSEAGCISRLDCRKSEIRGGLS